ncbi:MAG: GHKL domain-containing protein, partial [Gordonibacter sp.]|uniref:GHKL domain-containing protein n=2 Tax=Gordonibacter sp. TaxID=1968902 RepID=UPI002FC8A604
LPAVIGVHVLSRTGFFPTVALWIMGSMASFIVVFLQNLMVKGAWGAPTALSDLAQTGCLVALAVLLVLVAYRCLRTPFRVLVQQGRKNWMFLCLPVALVFLLLSYFKNSTASLTMAVLVFLTAASVFLIVVRVLVVSAAAWSAGQEKRAVAAQLEIQRREYEDVLVRMEKGRVYRHDMRHHLMVLEGLAGEESGPEMVRYLDGLGARLCETERYSYCENSAVNAVLSSLLGQAKEEGCAVRTDVRIPAAIPFDVLDVCALLSNALENALRACRGIHADRWIEVSAVMEGGWSLRICVGNSCSELLRFGSDGLPLAPQQEGRGIGLKSIEAIAKRHHGLLRCSCEEGTFRLHAVLFDAPKAVCPRKAIPFSRRAVQGAQVLVGACFFALVCLPTAAWALGGTPEWGLFSDVFNRRTESIQWGDTAFYADVPRVEKAGFLQAGTSGVASDLDLPECAGASDGVADAPQKESPTPSIDPPASGTISWESGSEGEGDASAPIAPVVPKPPDGASEGEVPNISEGIDDINRQMEEYVESMRSEFLWYAARKYQGYVGMDVTYVVTRNDESLLSIRFDATLNAGGSGQYCRTFTLDKRTGSVLKLGNLFRDGSDYVGVISGDVLRQMTEQVNAGIADYFIPGGIWSPDECFTKIDTDQEFYLDGDNHLVIVFEEYAVAPGKEGMPEFTVGDDLLAGMLRSTSLVR